MTRIHVCILAALILLLPAACRAQTISDIRAQAEAGLHERYTSGGQTFEADIPVFAPSSDSIPLIRVGRSDAEMDLESLNALAGCAPTFEPYTEKGYIKVFYTPTPGVIKGVQPWLVRTYSGQIDDDTLLEGDIGLTFGALWEDILQKADALCGKDFRLEFLSICQPVGYRTYDTRQGTWGDFVSVEPRSYTKDGIEYVEGMARHVVFAAQTLGGIPLLAGCNDGLWYEFLPDGRFAITATQMTVTGTLREDMLLCSLDEVKSQLRQRIENDRTPVSALYSLRLGYAVFEDGIAFPCWVAKVHPVSFGDVEYDDETWIFNAQTGRYIDSLEHSPAVIQ